MCRGRPERRASFGGKVILAWPPRQHIVQQRVRQPELVVLVRKPKPARLPECARTRLVVLEVQRHRVLDEAFVSGLGLRPLLIIERHHRPCRLSVEHGVELIASQRVEGEIGFARRGRVQPGELIGPYFAQRWQAMVVAGGKLVSVGQLGVRDMQLVLRFANERKLLGGERRGIERRVVVSSEPRIGHGHRLLRAAVIVESKIERVRHTRVGIEWSGAIERQLVVVSDGLALRDEKDALLIPSTRLDAPNMAVVLCCGEQPDQSVLISLVERVGVELVNLLTQRHALAGPHGFAPFIGVQRRALGVDLDLRLRQLALGKLCSREPACKARGEILAFEESEDPTNVDRDAGVKPGDRLDRRLIQLEVLRDVGAVRVDVAYIPEALGIDAFDATKATELAFNSVKVTVVIAVGRGEFGLAMPVAHRDLFHAVHGEWQFRRPRRARGLVAAGSTSSRARTPPRSRHRGC